MRKWSFKKCSFNTYFSTATYSIFDRTFTKLLFEHINCMHGALQATLASHWFLRTVINQRKFTNKNHYYKMLCVYFPVFCNKAVHIEVVINLSTRSFLNALNRLFNRRRKCSITDITPYGYCNKFGRSKPTFERNIRIISQWWGISKLDTTEDTSRRYWMAIHFPHYSILEALGSQL